MVPDIWLTIPHIHVVFQTNVENVTHSILQRNALMAVSENYPLSMLCEHKIQRKRSLRHFIANKIKNYIGLYIKRHLCSSIAMCFECFMNKVPKGQQQGNLHPFMPGRLPFSLFRMDHLDPFVKSSQRNEDILIIIDNFAKFKRLFPVKDTGKNTLALHHESCQRICQ